jgi:hypothetical protein
MFYGLYTNINRDSRYLFGHSHGMSIKLFIEYNSPQTPRSQQLRAMNWLNADKRIYTGCGLMGVYHCDVCGRSAATVQLCILQEKYCTHQHTQRTGTRPVAAKLAPEAGLPAFLC